MGVKLGGVLSGFRLMFLVDLVVSKKGVKFVKSVKENILIIYAPLWWREERAPYCSKILRLWV